MGRLLKGGVWTNVEDEVLKAAIMKYGTNQWARVASLLHRKSDKQCKARWYEWLSPTVKKTEWTQEENEKLLHLGKVLPTQWRTISDIIGRTAAQCVQQYSHLIDVSRSSKEADGGAESLRPDDGGGDLRPESRPAKPDPIDMAEDEIDMLNEARARLANTQGKKAKRKGRERQLIMARRLAAVQQKRELAEVGIIGRSFANKKRAGMNYNDEIPFYQPVPRGFHDTSRETLEPAETVIGRRVCELEFETREEREKRERKKDAELKRKKEDADLPGEIASGRAAKDAQIKRSKLVLAEPKISDEEMHTILKMSHESEETLRSAVATGLDNTNHLLGGYISERGRSSHVAPGAVDTRTPATNRLEIEAENIRSIHYTKTPLLGGANRELIEPPSEDRGQLRPGETPNTSLRRNLLGGLGPGAATPGATPTVGMRFNSNHKRKLVTEELEHLPAAGDDSLEYRKAIKKQKTERDGLEDAGKDLGTSGKIVDQSDLDRSRELERKRLEEEAWKRRSRVIQRNLPRPIEINHSILRPAVQPGDAPLTELQQADELVKLEMIRMLHYDNVMNPVEVPAAGRYATMSAGERKKMAEKSVSESKRWLEDHGGYEEFTGDEIRAAERLMDEEVAAVRREMGHGDINEDTFGKVWEECRAQVLYFPSEKRYTRANLVSRKDRIESYRHLHDLYTVQYAELTKRAKKKEDRLSTLLGGYMARSKLLQKAVADVFDNIERNEIELQSLRKIREQEQAAIANRIEALEMDVERQKQRENHLQKRYGELLKTRDQLKEELETIKMN